MGEREWVTTAAELATLDHDEIVAGYLDGFGGEPEPGANRSKSYWHGWWNGHRDKHPGSPDARGAAAVTLIRDCQRAWGRNILKWQPHAAR